jgi:hypothetical protein
MTKRTQMTKGDRTLIRDLSKAKWKPWPRPKPGKEIVTADLIQNIHAVTWAAYGFMFLSREEIAKAINKEVTSGSKTLSNLMTNMVQTEKDLKALSLIVQGAYARLLASGAALAEGKEAA